MKEEILSSSVGIIGGGWFGCHLALALKRKGFPVTLLEKDKELLSNGVSGKFGIRLHAGPHYPRSDETRAGCHRSFKKFKEEYPELLQEHAYSIYGLGINDANNAPPKVSKENFTAVCKECEGYEEIEFEKMGFQNLQYAAKVIEPSIKIGSPLRKIFLDLLTNAGVNIIYNFEVSSIQSISTGIVVSDGNTDYPFNYVINTTGYQSLLPTRPLPFNAEALYQPLLALVYQDTRPLEKPYSFIVMDGMNPCQMPYPDEENPSNRIVITHAKWTTLGTFKELSEANRVLSQVTDQFIDMEVKPNCEKEINRYWPEFSSRFIYIKWIGAVLAKMKTDKEFRGAITFQDMLSKMIFVFPGKISNIFDTENEILSLLNSNNLIFENDYCFVKGGVFDAASNEISEKPKDKNNNTCELQPYRQHLFFSSKETVSNDDAPETAAINKNP